MTKISKQKDTIRILAVKGIKAKNQEGAVTLLINSLFERGYVKRTYLNNVLQREKIYPTGLRLKGKIHVALPHGDAEHVKKMSLAVGVLEKPVKFHEMASDPKEESIIDASIIFVLAVNNPKRLVPYLSKMINDIFLKPDVVEAIKKAKSESEIESIVQGAIVGTTTSSP